MHGTRCGMYRKSLPDAPESGTIRLCELQGIHLHGPMQCVQLHMKGAHASRITNSRWRMLLTLLPYLTATICSGHADHRLQSQSRMGIALTVGVCRRTLSNSEAKNAVLAASSSAGKNKKRRRSYICSFSPGWTKYSTLYSEAQAAQIVRVQSIRRLLHLVESID